MGHSPWRGCNRHSSARARLLQLGEHHEPLCAQRRQHCCASCTRLSSIIFSFFSNDSKHQLAHAHCSCSSSCSCSCVCVCACVCMYVCTCASVCVLLASFLTHTHSPVHTYMLSPGCMSKRRLPSHQTTPPWMMQLTALLHQLMCATCVDPCMLSPKPCLFSALSIVSHTRSLFISALHLHLCNLFF